MNTYGSREGAQRRHRTARHGGWAGTANWLFFCGVVVLLFLFGGASRADTPAQFIVRSVAIIGIAGWSITLRSRQVARVRGPLIILGAAAALMLFQLVPLPAEWWTQAPGRAVYAEGYRLAGLSPPWHGLALTPDRTWNSLLALLPATAVLLGIASLDARRLTQIPLILLGLVVVAAFLAAVQISTGSLYPFEVTNRGSAVGFFANRNHLATFLAAAFVLIATWVRVGQTPAPDDVRKWFGFVFGALLIPLLLLTGSRAGIVFALIMLPAALLILRGGPRARRRAKRSLTIVPIAIAVLFTGATFLFGRDQAWQRLFASGDIADLRVSNIPLYWQMVRDFFPFGSGFGSFDPVFRMYEPIDPLSSTYLNHAHNELAEVAIEAGLPGLLIIVAALVWLARAAWRAWFGGAAGSGASRILARTGCLILFVLLLASLADYPLRTPALSSLAAIALGWLSRYRPAEDAADGALAASTASTTADAELASARSLGHGDIDA